MATKKDYYNIDDAYKLGTTKITIKIISKKEKEQIMENKEIIESVNDAIDSVNNEILYSLQDYKLTEQMDYRFDKDALRNDLDDIICNIDDAIDELARLLQELETIFDKID